MSLQREPIPVSAIKPLAMPPMLSLTDLQVVIVLLNSRTSDQRRGRCRQESALFDTYWSVVEVLEREASAGCIGGKGAAVEKFFREPPVCFLGRRKPLSLEVAERDQTIAMRRTFKETVELHLASKDWLRDPEIRGITA
jgi:hypothetical protein